jgi:hypothetical protein
MIRRRLVIVAVASAVMVAIAAGPVLGADWSRTVTFPSRGGHDAGTPLLDWNVLSDPTCSAGAWLGREFYDVGGGEVGGSAGGPGPSGGPLPNTLCGLVLRSAWVPAVSLSAGDYRIDLGWGGDKWAPGSTTVPTTLTVGLVQGLPADTGGLTPIGATVFTSTSCTGTADGGSYQGADACFTQESFVATVPSGASGISFVYSNNTAGPGYIKITPLSPLNGGDCIGAGALSWGSAGLSGNEWGDQWVPASGFPGCLAQGDHTVNYTPSDWVGGHQYQFEEQFAAYGIGGAARVQMLWLYATGPGLPFFDYTARHDQQGYLKIWSVTSPASSVGVRWVIHAGTLEMTHTVADVDVAGPGPSVGTETGTNGDLTQGCPSVLTNLQIPIVGVDVTVPDLPGLAGFIGCVVGNALDQGMFLLTGVVRSLFEPTANMAADVATLQYVASGKVPFVWISGVTSSLSAAFASPAGPDLSLGFTIMGAAVTFDPTLISGPLSAFRPYLLGGVWIITAWAILGQIGGALGMRGTGQQE